MDAKVAWFLAGCLLLGVASTGGVLCLLGWEAVGNGANVTEWLALFVPGVLLPLLGSVYCFFRLLGPDTQAHGGW